MIRNRMWSAALIGALGLVGCGDSSDGSAGAPASVLSTEQSQDATGQPRAGASGLIRTVELRVGGVSVIAEIADTPALRERGLMDRDSLPENQGMVFVYPDEQVRSFWMRNTPLALDIAFVDKNGSILNIETMEPNSDETTLSVSPAMYALEMSAGWFASNDVGPGARIEF